MLPRDFQDVVRDVNTLVLLPGVIFIPVISLLVTKTLLWVMFLKESQDLIFRNSLKRAMCTPDLSVRSALQDIIAAVVVLQTPITSTAT